MDVMQCFWFLAVLLTGAAMGAMVGHTLLLGRFLNWMFESNRTETFRDTYPAFIRAKRPQLLFDNLFTLALLTVTLYGVLLFLSSQLSILPVVAAGLQWGFVALFFGTGFAKLEGELFKDGNTSPDRVERFLSRNMPILVVSDILMLASFSCLILMKV